AALLVPPYNTPPKKNLRHQRHLRIKQQLLAPRLAPRQLSTKHHSSCVAKQTIASKLMPQTHALSPSTFHWQIHFL
ncbi:MAG TPA: hypothetical protein PLH67_04170, partial [Lentisphaeria bacterium]|nr:hypothetical protein [Lentisphaeria bacterium]